MAEAVEEDQQQQQVLWQQQTVLPGEEVRKPALIQCQTNLCRQQQHHQQQEQLLWQRQYLIGRRTKVK